MRGSAPGAVGAARGPGGRREIFLGLTVDMRWPIPTMPAVAVAVRVHRGYKDAREATQMEAVVPKLARFGANRAAKSDGVVKDPEAAWARDAS